MGPKRKPGGEERRQPKLTGQRPSPRRMSPKSIRRSPRVKTNSGSGSKTPAQRSPARRRSGETSVQKHGSKQHEQTPEKQDSSPKTPRSAGRYELRDVTPSFYGTRRVSKIFNTPGRTPRKTPFTTPFKKPKLRTLGRELAPDLKAAEKIYKEESQIWKEHLISFLNKTHKLCNLSSVYNFKYKTKSLRIKYESTLKNKVQEVYPSPLLTVKLATTACLTLKPGAVDAVYIHIKSLVPGITADNDRMMTVYSAWMIRSSHTQSGDAPGTEWFPVMLYTGREIIHHAVTEWLQGSFGCYVTKYGIRQNDLLWVAGVWSGRPCSVISHHKDNEIKVYLTYHINPPSGIVPFSPPNARGKPKLMIRISLRDIHHIWESIVDTSRDEMSVDELREFFSCMDNLTSEITCVPTSLLNLYQLNTPCITLNGDGKVRLTCGRSAPVVLNHLMDIFIQTTNCSALDGILKDAAVRDDLREGSENEEGATDEESP
ncbi:uncharacterized protein [Panulirus ornatus]|uniref:uncharacterized protein n=1 Tax=Panulirus ornatus TaxID=150431 RepID=UPI003A8B9528